MRFRACLLVFFQPDDPIIAPKEKSLPEDKLKHRCFRKRLEQYPASAHHKICFGKNSKQCFAKFETGYIAKASS
ncbi:hypothetical protein COW20_15425 [bacterium (Candidatus Blackallbacteria) CG13_big_fil_rev_8_21_14_2_50_49_14]|nr:MAG: hypothetical protein COW64_03690 [bacterium (Candidatus Blackallbacteria) CG18_big_fil_WC_8_21_14_2_50_49_26]PIW46310.1 MAG: hypothetical protein COW20_15425 [bacterium (Candidatus Blackallbacteria) CG13_big_fil_rev_8_21_14_2_50_49_14]